MSSISNNIHEFSTLKLHHFCITYRYQAVANHSTRSCTVATVYIKLISTSITKGLNAYGQDREMETFYPPFLL